MLNPEKWERTGIIVSMVDGHLFDTLSQIAQDLRKNTERPFSGIQARPMINFGTQCRLNVQAPQVVITGDFFQLPPVTKGNAEPFFAFESKEWKKCVEHMVTLTHVFRQKDHSSSSIII